MIVISSAELRANLKKYLDLAATEKIIIQRGATETYQLVKKVYKKPDADLANALTADEFLALVKQDIHEMFKLPR